MSSDVNHTRTSFDVYARPFVPSVLKNVNEAPANIIPCTPARWIDFLAYTRSFAGTDFIPLEKAFLQLPQVENASDGPHTDDATSTSSSTAKDDSYQHGDALDTSNYRAFFEEALKQEALGLHKECVDHDLYRVPVVKAPSVADYGPGMYMLHVPGLRELSLRIEVGDIVQLRQLRFNQSGEVVCGAAIKDPSGNAIGTPKKSDNQHNAVVWGIDRTRELLTLRIDSLAPRSMLFNVRFTVQNHRLGAMYQAAIRTQTALHQSSDTEIQWTRSMLFPAKRHGHIQSTLNKKDVDFERFDHSLNYEQSRAVNTVLNETYGTVPYIVSGPPGTSSWDEDAELETTLADAALGTGKTKTIVELALQLAAKRKDAHLLVCAPSDPAADTLVHRLSKHLKPSDMVRLNSPSRSFPEVPNTILPYCFVDDGMFSIPCFRDLMRLKIVVMTCRDAELLVRAQLSNNDLCASQQRLAAAIHPEHDCELPTKLHWTGLLIDEAAQAPEPEALIPLTVVRPPSRHKTDQRCLPVFVLAGDQHQLGPRTASKEPEIRTSLFERLLDRSFYKTHPLARSAQNNGVMRRLTQDMLPILRPAFTNLIRNYRSHPAIVALPSALFYSDTLEPEAIDTQQLLGWNGWCGRGWPVLFVSNTEPDEIEQDGGGWYNFHEAQLACRYAASFITSGLIAPKDVCIMSPFRAQVRILRKIAREPPFSMPAVNIGPLEAFQGLESRLVILCTTRTRDRFIEQDIARGLGVVHEPRRFNVAITRARQGLIVLGNPAVLRQDECWKAFLAFCDRNGLYKTANNAGLSDQEIESSAGVSRLERRLVHEYEQANGTTERTAGTATDTRRFGHAVDAEQTMWQEGLAAEAALQETESD